MKADELADLLLFWSAKEQKMITLAEYAKGMLEDRRPSTTPPATRVSAWPRCPW